LIDYSSWAARIVTRLSEKESRRRSAVRVAAPQYWRGLYVVLTFVAMNAYLIVRKTNYSRRYGWLDLHCLTIFLAAYLVLLTYGPGLMTPTGIGIQAAGQKIIVYVSVIGV